MVRLSGLLALALLLGFTVTGAAAPFSQSQTEVSLAFNDLGPVLTAPELGLPAGTSLIHPTAAVLPDGRVRLYYSTSPTGSHPSGPFSAISTDGVHFTPEPGERIPFFGGSGFGAWAQIERLPDGRWRLYYTHPGGSGAPDGIASAISDDGLSFAPEPGLRLVNPLPGAPFLSCCGIVRLADGRYRMYLAARLGAPPGTPPPPFQTYSATSSDLSSWALEPGVRQTGAGAPAALLTAGGSIMLVFQFGPPSAMQTSFSTDGLSFGMFRRTNLDGSDPTFVTLPDGRLLMYYASQAYVPTINAAVATFVTAPTVGYPSPPATAISATSARVSAIVDPHGATTNYAFDYGRSTAYGQATGLSAAPGTSGPQTVSATLTGLSPATTYHFRADAYNPLGTVDGEDRSFTTAAAKCRLRAGRDHGWEVAFAHARTRTAGARALRQARMVARGTALLERDGCADYEAAIAGLTHKAAVTASRRARRLGFRHATLERT